MSKSNKLTGTYKKDFGKQRPKKKTSLGVFVFVGKNK